MQQSSRIPPRPTLPSASATAIVCAITHSFPPVSRPCEWKGQVPGCISLIHREATIPPAPASGTNLKALFVLNKGQYNSSGLQGERGRKYVFCGEQEPLAWHLRNQSREWKGSYSMRWAELTDNCCDTRCDSSTRLRRDKFITVRNSLVSEKKIYFFPFLSWSMLQVFLFFFANVFFFFYSSHGTAKSATYTKAPCRAPARLSVPTFNYTDFSLKRFALIQQMQSTKVHKHY